jgi:carboxyl-terminal processing protease
MKTSMHYRFAPALLAGFVLAAAAQEPPASQPEPEPEVIETEVPATETAGSVDELPLEEIRTFTEVFAKVKNDYVEPVDDRTLLESAIRGMLEGLDPHSAYLDQEAYRDLQEGTSGEFGGLGIEVGVEDGFIKVIAPIDDTPAYRAGVKAGDLIIRLDDTPVKGMPLNDAVDMMRGNPGTQITLTIVREGEERPFTITITRDVIKVRSVRSRTLEPGYGYLRISNFQLHTADDVVREIDSLRKNNSAGLKGMVIDLRNNPGGILSSAVAVSDLFLEQGLIVYTEGRVRDSKLKFNAKPVDVLEKAPLVVLVNAGSASASEIMAGALQDHRRAIIMGQKTFGKGSVQTILPMANEAALKLTTARYYTPNGRSIQAEGIAPDIIVEQLVVEEPKEDAVIVTEANLTRHLENDAEGDQDAAPEQSGSENAPPATPPEGKEPSLAGSDYALYQALNVLKGLVILEKKAG